MSAVLTFADNRSVARSCGFFALCLGAWNAALGLECLPGFRASHSLVIELLALFLLLLPATILHTAYTFSGKVGSQRTLVGAYGLGAVLCLLQTQRLVFDGFQTFAWGAIGNPGPLLPIHIAFMIVATLIGCSLCATTVREDEEPLAVLRAKYWLMGAAVALPLGTTNFLVNYGVPILPLGSLGTVALMAILTYAATTHRLLDPKFVLVKGTARCMAIVAGMIPLVTGVIALWTLPLGLAASAFTASVLIVMSAGLVLLPAFRLYLEAGVESSLFPERHTAREALRRFSKQLVRLGKQEELAKQLVSMLVESLGVTCAGLYLADDQRSAFQLVETSGTESDRVAHLLRKDDVRGRKSPTKAGAARFPWETWVPVAGDRKIAAFITLGPKKSGAAIDDSDQTLLSMVAAQLSVALKNGEYLAKIEQQKGRIEALRKRVEAENTSLRAEVRTHSQFSEIIGASTALRDTLDYVARIAPTEATVLIVGETGTGKELIARAIHDLSPRAKGPLISVNCPAIPVDIAESELFGHERGAYTGAVDTYPGKFEMANGGTIFLDEVADLPINVQTKLLRVLQEREVQRLGSHKVRSIDVRILSATNRDLQEEIRRGRFREDLYFRLATVPVYLPSLRERIGDVNMLASFFLDRAATRYQKSIEGISPDAVNVLSAYSWPGNIRELQHVIERAVLLCTSRVLEPEHLSDLGGNDEPLPATLGDAMREEKLRRVREALHATSGNQAAAARLLGMSRSNLARLIKRYGIDPLDFVN